MNFRSLRAITAFSAVLLVSAPVHAQEDTQNFIGFASEHCRAFIVAGKADLSFAMGKAAAKFTNAELMEFSRQFAQKLVRVYDIDPAQGCVLDVVSKKPVPVKEIHPDPDHRRKIEPLGREIAVVAGVMKSHADTPVSVAYRLERAGNNAWRITNISINGQPMVDRYRVEYETLAKKGGSKMVMDNL